MVLAVTEEERRGELKAEAEAVLVQDLQDLVQGQSHALNLAPDQDLALNLDLESRDPGQPVDLDPGVDQRGREVGPRGLEVGQQGPDLGQPSQAVVRGQALAVLQDPGPRVEQDQGQGVLGEDQDQEVQQSRDQAVQQNQSQGVQGDQDLEVVPNLDLGVQQGQDPQAHQGRDLPELDRVAAICCYCLYHVGSIVPISSVKSIFGFAGYCATFGQEI